MTEKQFFSIAPHEIILKLVIQQDFHNQIDNNANEDISLKKVIFPCYQLLMTCKKFYFSDTLKQSLYKALLDLPEPTRTIFVKHRMLEESNPIQKLTVDNNFIRDCYISDEHCLFFQNNLDKIICVKSRNSEKLMSVPEFLIENMINAFPHTSFKPIFNHEGIWKAFRIHFDLLNYLCVNADLSLSTLNNTNQSIAEFLIENLTKNNHPFNYITILDGNLFDIQQERYKKRHSVNQIPETISLDLTLLLSDEALEKLCSAAEENNKVKNEGYNKKLLNWVLPELSKGHIKQSWRVYFIRCIRSLLSVFFKKICLLMSMIKDCFYNHI